MLNTVSFAPGPSLPAPAVPAAAPVASTVTRYEDLPNELLMQINADGLQRNTGTVLGCFTGWLGSFNARLTALNAEATAASRVMLALEQATNRETFSSALLSVADMPLQQRQACQETAWHALDQLSSALPAAHIEAILRELLGDEAANAALRPAAWKRAVSILLKQRLLDPSAEIVAQLMTLGAQEPQLSPSSWRRLLQLAERATHRRFDESLLIAAADKLSKPRQADIDHLLECVWLGLQHSNADEMAATIDRIETLGSPEGRFIVLETLWRCWPDVPASEYNASIAAIHGALLRVQGPDKVAALKLLPPVTSSEMHCRLLLDELAAMSVEDALQALQPHIYNLKVDDYGRLSSAVSRRAFEECERLDPPARIALLTNLDAIERGSRRWKAAWRGALRDIRGTLPVADPRALAQTLVRGLGILRGRESLLSVLLPVIRTLEPEDRARALQAVANRWWGILAGCSAAHYRTLLELCADLPLYLRVSPLKALVRLSAVATQGCYPQVDRLWQRTDAERLALTGPPAPQRS